MLLHHGKTGGLGRGGGVGTEQLALTRNANFSMADNFTET